MGSKNDVNIRVVSLLFLFVFGAPIEGFPLNTAKIAVILLGIGVIRRRRAREAFARLFRSKINLFIIFSLSLLAVYSAWWPTIKGTGDLSLSYIYVIFILERVLGSFLFVSYAHSFGFSIKDYVSALIYVLIAQAIIIISMFFFTGIREFFWAINDREGLEDLAARYGGIRGMGFAGGIAYTMSVALSIGVILIVYSSYKFGYKWWHSVGVILLVSGMLFSGRTGWLGVAIALSLYLYLNNLYRYLVTIRGFMFRLIPISVLFAAIYSYFLGPETIRVITERLIPFAFEIFINLFERGELTASSLEATQEMYFPVSESTFWFGDGRWSSLPGKSYGYYMRTDAGYMRQMLFYGVIMSVVFYSIYLIMLVHNYLYYTKAEVKGLNLVLGVLVAYFFVVHWKGAFLEGSNMNTKVVLVIHSIIVLAMRHQQIYLNKTS